MVGDEFGVGDVCGVVWGVFVGEEEEGGGVDGGDDNREGFGVLWPDLLS